jgi:serine protease Do
MNKRHLALTLLLALGAAAAPAAEFSQEQLQRAYDRITPALGLLEFSVEMVSERSGETSRRDSNALAVVVSPDGLVMTHGHLVLENAKPFNLRVKLGRDDRERSYDATLLQKPDDLNVAFLQLKSDTPLNLPYVRFSPGGRLSIGEPIALFGLLGETLDYAPALEEARVGAILESPRRTYCVDRNVRFGFVGGPVLDRHGNVIGVLGFDLSRAEGGEVYTRSGHPLVYQAQLFQQHIQNPPGEHRPDDGSNDAWLGVFTQPLTDDFARYWNLPPTGGLIVSTVVPQSPAARAGLRPGDVLTRFGDTRLTAKQDREVVGFTKLVRETGPGKVLSIDLLRDGQPVTVEVTLGGRPRTASDADEYEAPHFGLTVRELTQDIRIALNLSEDVQGVIVRRVTSGSIAQLGKLQPGVVIVRFGGYNTGNIAEFREAVDKILAEKPGEVTVFGRVGPQNAFFRLDPRWTE